ncbi:MAG: hypothetical protein E7401_01680 [Ruminococcaceae bacterium]|nr:hypothetical protein [Oscillospiraceae bacterium]
MYKIAILGCENSHANTFLNFIIKDKIYTDIEVVGVYSDDMEAANKLNEDYGVYAAKSYDEFVGKVDGIVITARHGDNHYKYAKPYIESGIPMFIDKPITISEAEALELKEELIKSGTKVCGGSVCRYPKAIQELKKNVQEKTYGEVYGGSLRAPVDMNNDYGNFFFYAQHLAQAMCEIFGYYPNSVKAFVNGKVINCIVRYDDYDVNLVFVEGKYTYYATINCAENVITSKYIVDDCFGQEFETFYKLLKGEDQPESYEDFIAPVFILNAIDRSIKSGNEEKVLKQ